MEYDDETPSLTLANGEVHKADVIVAADGMQWACPALSSAIDQ